MEAVCIRVILGMQIEEAGQEGSHERAVFRIQLVRELARAVGLGKKFFEIKQISAGSIVVDVDILADPMLSPHSHRSKF
jgi:hypothetical protein